MNIRVKQLAKELNISTNDILAITRTFNPEININSLLTENDRIYLTEKISKLKIDQREQTENYLNNRIKNWFFEDFFNQIKVKDGDFESCFNDNDVINLVSKLKNKALVRRAFDFSCTLSDKNEKYYEMRDFLHSICNELKNKYGSKMLTFIFKIPKVGQNYKPDNIYTSIAKSDEEEFGYFRIAETGQCIKFSRIDFGVKKEPYILITKNSKLVATVDKDGLIQSFGGNSFGYNLYEKIVDGRVEFHTGNLEVYCSVCGRPLTDPQSILLGAGPTCSQRR